MDGNWQKPSTSADRKACSDDSMRPFGTETRYVRRFVPMWSSTWATLTGSWLQTRPDFSSRDHVQLVSLDRIAEQPDGLRITRLVWCWCMPPAMDMPSWIVRGISPKTGHRI